MSVRPSRFLASLALLAAALSLAACEQAADFQANADADPLIQIEDTDAAMNAAMAEAQSTLNEWLDVLADPPQGTSQIGFKYPLEGVEHIWVGNVARDGDALVGNLMNAPQIAGFAQGDTVIVPLSEVSDWAYRDASGLIHGHRTTRVLFDQLPPETVAEIKSDFGWE